MGIFGSPSIKQMQQKGDIEGLAQALHHPARLTRDKAAHALGDLGDPRAVEYFIDTLASPSSAVRLLGVRALERLRDPRAVAPLIAACTDPAKEVRLAAIRALYMAKDARAIAPLLSACDDPDSDVRRAAVQALKDAGYETQVDDAYSQSKAAPVPWENAIVEKPLRDKRALDSSTVLPASEQNIASLYWRGLTLIALGGTILCCGTTRTRQFSNEINAVALFYFVFILVLKIATCGIGVWMLNKGSKLANRARRIKLFKAQKPIADDARPPVLYLRSFRDDTLAAKPSGGNNGLRGLLHPSEFVFTEEEQLAYALGELGPFVAVGRPGEELPELGAVRFYVDGDAWQQTVTELMSQARLVVLRTGMSRGLWWEIQRAVDLVPPERLLFIVSIHGVEYAAFRERANQYLPCRLPDQIVQNWVLEVYGIERANFQTLKGFISFDSDWTPHYLLLKDMPVNRKTKGHRPALVMRRVLQPVFKHLEEDWLR